VLPLNWPININGRLRCSCKKTVDCSSPAKHPLGRLVSRGLLDASTDEPTVRRWFADEPSANLGVATDKLVVLDADPRHGGGETLAALEREHQFPPTWRVLTGGGGEHVIFACPPGVTVSSSQARDNPVLGEGIDVRAQHGYIVAPPSRHISGRPYAWSVGHHPRDVPLAKAPAWLVERLAVWPLNKATRKGRISPETWERLICEPVREYHDAAAVRLFGKLLAHGLETTLAVGFLRAWNATVCEPPLAETALAEIVRRVADREAQKLEGGG
jgi:hypothetical protein